MVSGGIVKMGLLVIVYFAKVSFSFPGEVKSTYRKLYLESARERTKGSAPMSSGHSAVREGEASLELTEQSGHYTSVNQNTMNPKPPQ